MDPINELILNHPNLEDVENEVRNAAQLITECLNQVANCCFAETEGAVRTVSTSLVKWSNSSPRTDLEPRVSDKLGPELSVNCMGDFQLYHSFDDWIHTAFNNDDNPEFGFAQQVIAFGNR